MQCGIKPFRFMNQPIILPNQSGRSQVQSFTDWPVVLEVNVSYICTI